MDDQAVFALVALPLRRAEVAPDETTALSAAVRSIPSDNMDPRMGGEDVNEVFVLSAQKRKRLARETLRSASEEFAPS